LRTVLARLVVGGIVGLVGAYIGAFVLSLLLPGTYGLTASTWAVWSSPSSAR
jgi:hypothetical protein